MRSTRIVVADPALSTLGYPSKHPSCLAFLELAISIPFNGKHPPACDKVLRFELPDVDQVKDVIVKPRLDLRLDKHTGIDLELF